jgi:hypothetical protein
MSGGRFHPDHWRKTVSMEKANFIEQGKEAFVNAGVPLPEGTAS